ncbi:hypothetical protein SAMN05444280_11192 [Tangfeifania diversioriginum]|uniref:RimK-like ATP-grasp domain-containing protein n=1 Tax=Tangfeifania diversioriginum TaxID=1168035 RepID=A0A1M6GRL7_9BACT|nr:hypothetical protein [Tangfeifania diversioriginum]SHJ12548.1 hypothetical protein SAMN05444280_11192 [Tangfeifania diversioriginum]
MEVGLLLNSNNRLCPYSERYKEILDENNIHFKLIDPNSYTLFDELQSCSHLLFHHTQGDTDMLIYESLFYIAQNVFNIKCYPNFETYWSYENKIKEYYLLKSHGFPIIDSQVFWNNNHAYNFLNETEFPIIAKLSKGASSSNVVILNSFGEGKKIIDQVFNDGVKVRGLQNRSNLTSISNVGYFNYGKATLKSILLKLNLIKEKIEYPEWQIQKDSILFQKYLPNNTFDTRITIIGDRAFAFRRFVRENDFRASGSGKIDVNPDKIDIRCIEIAFSVSKKLNFNTMAYDFIYDEEKEPWINEISYCFVDSAVQSCPGHWDEKLNWHKGQCWPQKCQLEDFLELNI